MVDKQDSNDIPGDHALFHIEIVFSKKRLESYDRQFLSSASISI